jgi:transcriptional regulator with XRE-family HTH domain
MRNTPKDFKARAFARPDVHRKYEGLREEFEILDEILKARAEAGVTQAELAARMGTTQSAVARLETAMGKHSPSIGTLKRYAAALGYRLQLRLVKERGFTDGHKTYSVPVDANALLERVRAIRCIPRGIRVTDRRLNSLKGRLKGMSKRKVRRSKRVCKIKH